MAATLRWWTGQAKGMNRDEPTSLTIAGHEGQLRRVVAQADVGEPQWLWEGSLDGPGVAALIRSLMQTGSFPCDWRGAPHRAVASCAWYDAGRGAVVLELRGPPERLA
jgi:hypothetical protein